ncbi:fucolectin-1-like [Haliotis asinina]|uniref:fucolectin-1-like n=1 Tax=Haliotis asinina TaxID=109174 RepID=UPI0035326C70
MKIGCVVVALLFCGLISQIDGVCRCRRGCRYHPRRRCSGYPNKCYKGWSGPYCQRKNVAFEGTTAQSDQYSVLMSPGFAVDGNTNPNTAIQCAMTGESNNAWWNVRLSRNGINQIKYMKIYNLDYDPERRTGMEILVNGNVCYQFPPWEIPEVVESITCDETMVGDVVTIRVPGSHLTLCEVEVYVCSDYWFGQNCDKECHCAIRGEICDKGTGACESGCAPGYNGTDCQ